MGVSLTPILGPWKLHTGPNPLDIPQFFPCSKRLAMTKEWVLLGPYQAADFEDLPQQIKP